MIMCTASGARAGDWRSDAADHGARAVFCTAPQQPHAGAGRPFTHTYTLKKTLIFVIH
jgi:hypothetical protein